MIKNYKKKGRVRLLEIRNAEPGWSMFSINNISSSSDSVNNENVMSIV